MNADSRFFDLSARTKLRLSGADRVRFLNGQTTNDVRKAGADKVQESCVLNAKGHLDAHIFLFATANEIWLDAAEALREQLPGRLERYIIADDVVVHDTSELCALFHVLAETKPAGVKAQFCLRSQRLGVDGWDVWVELAGAEEVSNALAAAYQRADKNEWERLRIENGIPRWGCELTPDVIPPEANLAQRTIDYEKGCYIGQEVISRMKMSSQLRQQLCGLVSERALTAGTELRQETKVVGRVTSAAFSPRMNSNIGLGMIKRGYNGIGSRLIASTAGAQANVSVIALPMKSASAAPPGNAGSTGGEIA